ncbi:MAG: cupin domain-containing protein [Armatimonadota bacterium]
MLIRDIRQAHYFTAGDQTTLCELLHPAREEASLTMYYSLAHATLAPGKRSLPHRLKTSSEVYFILSGQGRMHIDDECAEVGAGQAIYTPPGSDQWIENTGTEELSFLAIVSPMWRADDEEINGNPLPPN